MTNKIEDTVFDEIPGECKGVYESPFEVVNVKLTIYKSGKGDFTCNYLLPGNLCDNLEDEANICERKKCPYAGILNWSHS